MTLTVNVPPRMLGRFESVMSKEIKPHLEQALRLTGRQSITVLKERSQGIKAVGWFQHGWQMKELPNLKMRVFNAAAHAIFVEKGRRAGAKPPPLEPIRRWLVVKGGDPAAAPMVARAIARRGIAPRPVMTSKAWQDWAMVHFHANISKTMTALARRSAGRV